MRENLAARKYIRSQYSDISLTIYFTSMEFAPHFYNMYMKGKVYNNLCVGPSFYFVRKTEIFL